MKVVTAILGFAGLALLVGGIAILSEAGTGGDFRGPIGVLMAGAGVVIAYFGLVGWLQVGNKGDDAEDIRQKDLWQAFLQLAVVRKLTVVVSLPFIVISGLGLLGFLFGDSNVTASLITGGIGALLFQSAWPSVHVNFKNTRRQGRVKLLIGVVIAFGILIAAGALLISAQKDRQLARRVPETRVAEVQQVREDEPFKGTVTLRIGI